MTMSLERIKLDVELSDGSVHHLVIGNPSLVSWDRTRSQFQWPTATDAPILWLTYIAWHHMKATKAIPDDVKFKTFEEELCAAVDEADDEAATEAAEAAGEIWPGDAVDPTATTPESVSASP
jgi:hypothetical protein